MRGVSLLLLAVVAGSCAAALPEPTRSAKAERRFQELIGGKVAQPPSDCLPVYRYAANDMVIIDESTVVFQRNRDRAYVTHMGSACPHVGVGPYALVTRQVGTAQICRGDIAEVVDTMAHQTVGSCVFGDFTPYVRPGS